MIENHTWGNPIIIITSINSQMIKKTTHLSVIWSQMTLKVVPLCSVIQLNQHPWSTNLNNCPQLAGGSSPCNHTNSHPKRATMRALAISILARQCSYRKLWKHLMRPHSNSDTHAKGWTLTSTLMIILIPVFRLAISRIEDSTDWLLLLIACSLINCWL